MDRLTRARGGLLVAALVVALAPGKARATSPGMPPTLVGPVVDNNIAVLGYGEYEVTTLAAVDVASHRRLWTKPAPDGLVDRLLTAQGLLVIPVGGCPEVYEMRTGRDVGSLTAGHYEFLRVAAHGSRAVALGYRPSSGDRVRDVVVMFSLTNLQPLWQRELTDAEGRAEEVTLTESGVEVTTALEYRPVADSEYAVRGLQLALRLEDGKLLAKHEWAAPGPAPMSTPQHAPPVTIGSSFAPPDGVASVWAEGRDGKRHWTTDVPGTAVAALAGGLVLVGTNRLVSKADDAHAFSLLALGPETGKLLWSTKLWEVQTPPEQASARPAAVPPRGPSVPAPTASAVGRARPTAAQVAIAIILGGIIVTFVLLATIRLYRSSRSRLHRQFPSGGSSCTK